MNWSLAPSGRANNPVVFQCKQQQQQQHTSDFFPEAHGMTWPSEAGKWVEVGARALIATWNCGTLSPMTRKSGNTAEMKVLCSGWCSEKNL